MTARELADSLRPWLRPEHAPAFEAALAWLWPRCRTDEERCLAPALLLLLAPLNALVAPCRPAPGSSVDFQVTLSRQTTAGPERVRLIVRAAHLPQRAPGAHPRSNFQRRTPNTEHRTAELWLDSATVTADPLGNAVRVLGTLLHLDTP